MGCLKIAHRAKNEPALSCVWNAEKQEKTCANLYDYGARFYDPVIGRFTTQDPLASDFTSWTPYHYVHNNPIMLIDPTGMAADGFTIDEDGLVEKVDDTGRNKETGKNEYDVVYRKDEYEAAKASGGTNEYGNPAPENQQVVSDTDILPASVGKGTVIATNTSGDINNMMGLFKFCSDNSDVEWSYFRYKSDNVNHIKIATLHVEWNTISHETIGITDKAMQVHIHSHPGIIKRWEYSSVGMTNVSVGGYRSDYQHAHDWFNRNGKQQPFKSYVYFPISGSVLDVSAYGVEYLLDK